MTKGTQGNLRGDGCLLNLDWGGGNTSMYIWPNLPNLHTLIICKFLYTNYTPMSLGKILVTC